MKKLFYAFGRRIIGIVPPGRRITAGSDARIDANGNTRVIAST